MSCLGPPRVPRAGAPRGRARGRERRRLRSRRGTLLAARRGAHRGPGRRGERGARRRLHPVERAPRDHRGAPARPRRRSTAAIDGAMQRAAAQRTIGLPELRAAIVAALQEESPSLAHEASARRAFLEETLGRFVDAQGEMAKELSGSVALDPAPRDVPARRERALQRAAARVGARRDRDPA